MTQFQLNRAVARATGDCLSTIRRLGFGPLMPTAPESEREPLVVDWDDLEQQRSGPSPLARHRRTAAIALRPSPSTIAIWSLP